MAMKGEGMEDRIRKLLEGVVMVMVAVGILFGGVKVALFLWVWLR